MAWLHRCIITDRSFVHADETIVTARSPFSRSRLFHSIYLHRSEWNRFILNLGDLSLPWSMPNTLPA